MRQMKIKNSNTTRFETLSTNLVSVLHTLAIALEDTRSGYDSGFCQKQIFAAARQVQKTARLSGIMNRFNTEVESDPNTSVFSEHHYKYSIYNKRVNSVSAAQNNNLFNRSPHGMPFGSGCRPVTRK